MTLIRTQLQQMPRPLHQSIRLRHWLWLGPGLSLLLSMVGGTIFSLPIDQWLGIEWMIRSDIQTKDNATLDLLMHAFGAVTGTGIHLSLHPSHHFTWMGQAFLSVLMTLGLIHRLVFGLMLGLLMLGKMAEQLGPDLIKHLSYESNNWQRHWWRLITGVTLIVMIMHVFGALWLVLITSTSSASDMGLWQAWFDASSALSDNGTSLSGPETPYSEMALGWLGFFPLILLAGLGLPLWWELGNRFLKQLKKLLPSHHGDKADGQFTHPFSLHTQLTLITGSIVALVSTLLMIILMALDSYINSSKTTVVKEPLRETILDAAFLVSTRSTAFAETEMYQGHPIALFLIIPLLLIGGGAGGAMGGLSLTTIAIPALSFWSFLKGRDNIEGHQRSIPIQLLQQAITLIITMLALGSLGIFLLGLVEPANLDQITLYVFSALSNSGLGMIPGASLTGYSKCVLMILMWLGLWLGPTLIAASKLREEASVPYQYPCEDLTLG